MKNVIKYSPLISAIDTLDPQPINWLVLKLPNLLTNEMGWIVLARQSCWPFIRNWDEVPPQ